MHNNLLIDLAAFTAAFPAINATFLGEFQDAIDEADAIPLAFDDYNQLEVLSETVEEKMDICRKHYGKLIAYVKMIYPNSKSNQDVFWADKYRLARNDQRLMIDLMESCFRHANSATYKADLIAEGFLQADIDLINTYGQALDAANIAQEDMKSSLKVKTDERISKYNAVWAFMRKTSAASKVVFSDSAVKQEQYMLYPEHTGPSVPTKVQNLNYDLVGTKLKWDIAVGADTYELQKKIDMPAASFDTIYVGTDNEFVYTPPAGVWVFRCRGENAEGSGAWSNEFQWIQE